MSYLMQSRLAADGQLYRRVVACAACEPIPDAENWVTNRMWRFSAQPGWVAAYASAFESNSTGSAPPPGENEAAITDGMILSAVQALNSPSE